MKLEKIPYFQSEFVLFLVFIIFASCSGNLTPTLLLEDGFDELPPGYISSSEGALTEYHYLPSSGQMGEWTVSAFGWQSAYNTAWELIGAESGNYLRQNYYAVNNDLDLVSRYTHPIITAGDSVWHDYKIEFRFSPMELTDKCGLLFRYQNSRCYYFYGMEGNMLVLKIVKNATAPHRPFEKVLISTPFNWKKGEIYKGEVSIQENQILTLLNDSLNMTAKDFSFSRGKVGFLSDVPANFYGIKVTTLNRENRKIKRYKSQLANSASMRINENSRPVVWKKLSTSGFGTGRNLRFGDLNNDGDIDLLIGQVRNHGPSGSYPELSCLTAMTFDGELLWQKGVPDPEKYKITSDVAFQIHDLDGDGKNEVIFTMDFKLNIINGKTGRLIKRIPTPLSRTPGDKYKRILGDCIYFCDLSGKGRDCDILIKDRYSNVWAYDEHLNFLWTQSCKTGHYPYACDIDGDGKDEVIIGYSLIDDDGRMIWNKDKEMGDHADAVIIAANNFQEDTTLKIFYGAGDWGAMILDLKGNILVHKPIGHVQNTSIANFRSDLPGLEMVSVNFWGNQGIIHLFDANGNIYHSFEPGPYGSLCFPVNWRGDGLEYFLLNTNPGDGGLFDGNGMKTVVFPDDGHPDMCNAVLDLTGDSRDEIVTWDKHEIWVYTQVGNSRQGKIYHPIRNPLYNYSNYQFNLSLPDWEE